MGAQGEVSVNMGAFPGTVDRQFASVLGQTGFVSTSLCEAWILPRSAGTADHTVDEHFFENLKAMATYFTDGALLVWLINDNRLLDTQTGEIPRVYGLWNVAWCWN